MERFTAVGPLSLCNKGERVILYGNFVSHPRYGKQFKADRCEVLAPATLSAIESYLGSGMIKGIGEVTKCTETTNGEIVSVPLAASLPSPLEQFLSGEPAEGCGITEAKALTRMMELAYGQF